MHMSLEVKTYIVKAKPLPPSATQLTLGFARVNPCEKINRSHTHTHTHRQRTTPPTPTHTRTRQERHPKPPNEHLPQTLHNARRWRDDGACHLPRPCGCEHNNPDSLDARLFPSVVLAVAPAVSMKEASALLGLSTLAQRRRWGGGWVKCALCA